VVTAERGFAINALAWGHLSVPVRASFAEQYLLHHRGIDLRPLHAEQPGQPFIGYAGRGWTSLVDALRRDGVTAARADRHGPRPADPRRPAHRHPPRPDHRPRPRRDHRIRGFIGRDISGNPRAPKYRNPTHTPTFDKSRILYRPSHHVLDPGGTVVIVEGVLDALAIAAAAAAAGRSRQFAPCAANGVTVSAAQVGHILGLAREAHCVVALDGDQAGRDGTARWLHELTIRHGKPAFVAALPPGADPAMWLQHHDPDDGLDSFAHPGYLSTAAAAPYLPARELTRLAGRSTDGGGNTTAGDVGSQQRIANVCRPPDPPSAPAPTRAARWLLEESKSEMTRLGWDAGGAYRASLHRNPDARALLETPLLVEGPTLSLSKSLVPRPGVEL
jgi:DNA primase